VVVGVWWGPRFTRPLLGPFDDKVLPDYGETPRLGRSLEKTTSGAVREWGG
jgi:hypothetical protein